MSQGVNAAPGAGAGAEAAARLPTRLPSLDGLRAVAILCVLVTHATTTVGFPAQALLRRPFGVIGLLGVEIFFVLSGFLVASILLRETDLTGGTFSLRNFWARRALRILPVFLCLVAVLIILRATGYIYIRARGWIELGTFTVNFRYHPRWSVGHLWYLAVEIHFYLLFGLALRWMSPRTVVRVLLGVLAFGFGARWVALLFFRHDPVFMEMVEYMTFTRLDSLATGCLLAFAARDPAWRARLDALARRGWFVSACVVGVLLVLVASDRVWWFLPAAGNTGLALLLPVIVWAAVRHAGGAAGAVLNSRPFVALGLASYSVYLWQQLFLFQDRPEFIHHFPQNVVFTLIVAFISYRLVECPFLTLKERFSVVPTGRLACWDTAEASAPSVPAAAPVAPPAA